MAFDNQVPAAAGAWLVASAWAAAVVAPTAALLLPRHIPLLTICDSSASTELSAEAVLGPGFSSCVGGVWVI